MTPDAPKQEIAGLLADIEEAQVQSN